MGAKKYGPHQKKMGNKTGHNKKCQFSEIWKKNKNGQLPIFFEKFLGDHLPHWPTPYAELKMIYFGLRSSVKET